MPVGTGKRVRCFLWLAMMLQVSSLLAQQTFPEVEIPSKFNLDMETAARLRAKVIAASVPAVGPYLQGKNVLDRLLTGIPSATRARLQWQLRIVEDGQWNAYSSPDGLVFVESGLAKLAGDSGGLWAAVLSHEIAHVLHRDWARRYLYEKSVDDTAGAGLALGAASFSWSSWVDSSKASSDFARFCRQMELNADRTGLMLMARAGYHPDFVPALHHVLHARFDDGAHASPYSMHPGLQERDRELRRAYVEASIEFEHLWTDWHASPGGNPPVVVFAEEARVSKAHGKEWQVSVPIRCQNLAGSVEVVLRGHTLKHADSGKAVGVSSEGEIRQVTGCTSPKTTVTFQLENRDGGGKDSLKSTDIYFLDGSGAVIARADLTKLRR